MIDPLISVYKDLSAYRKIQEQLRTIESGGGSGSAYGSYISMLANLPMCRGVWSMANVASGGNVSDVSGLGKTLTYNGNGQYSYVDNVWPYYIPRIALDGTGDYLSRASEADNQITGAETYVASELNGLTMFLWILRGAYGTDQSLMGKWNTTGNQRAYILNFLPADTPQFVISVDGTNIDTIVSSEALSAGSTYFWNFIAARFEPSNEIAIWVNDTKDTDTSGIAASIFATSTAELQIGARNAGTVLFSGLISCAALYAGLVPDDVIDNIYALGRELYYF